MTGDNAWKRVYLKKPFQETTFFCGMARLGGAFGGLISYQPEDQQAAGEPGARCRRVKVARSFEAHRIKIIFWRRAAETCDMKRVREGHDHENKKRRVADRDAGFLRLRNRARESPGPKEIFGSGDAGQR